MVTNSFRIEFSGHPPMRWLNVHPQQGPWIFLLLGEVYLKTRGKIRDFFFSRANKWPLCSVSLGEEPNGKITWKSSSVWGR